MTNEEKAKKHIKDNYVVFEDIMQVEHQLDSLREKDYLAGLAKGREEGYAQGKETLLEMNEVLDSIDAKAKIKSLEKENAELNRDKTELTNSVTELKTKITELEKQIDQLSNDNHVLKTAFITQKAQIEKMKSCNNCKHRMLGYPFCTEKTVIYTLNPYKKNGMKSFCENMNKWELAE